MSHNADLVRQLVVCHACTRRRRGKKKGCGSIVVLDTRVHHAIADVRSSVSPVAKHAGREHHGGTLPEMAAQAAQKHLGNLFSDKADNAWSVPPHFSDEIWYPLELLAQRELFAAPRRPVRQIGQSQAKRFQRGKHVVLLWRELVR